MIAFTGKGLLKFTLFAASVGIAGHWGFVKLYGERFNDAAIDRVNSMLVAMKAGDRQTAACLWSTGRAAFPDADIIQTVAAFEDWARDSGIEKIAAFTVGEARLEREPPLGQPA